LFIVEEEIDAEVDYEGEIISELKEPNYLRKMVEQLEHQLKDKYQDADSIISLKVELEEGERIMQFFSEKPNKKEEICEKFEEVVFLRGELDYLNRNLKLLQEYEPIYHILNIQRSPLIKIGLGYQKYHETSKDEDPSRTPNGEQPKSYVHTFIISSINIIEDSKK